MTGARRSPLAPDTPTFAEAGLAAMHHAAWYGVLAAPTVAAPARDALALRLHAALQRTALRQRLTQDGAEPLGWVGPAAADYLAAQRESWRDAVALVGTRLG